MIKCQSKITLQRIQVANQLRLLNIYCFENIHSMSAFFNSLFMICIFVGPEANSINDSNVVHILIRNILNFLTSLIDPLPISFNFTCPVSFTLSFFNLGILLQALVLLPPSCSLTHKQGAEFQSESIVNAYKITLNTINYLYLYLY